MPLRDHFHPPLDLEVDWVSFHSTWANTLVRHFNERLLPARYRAQPEVRLGQQVIVDVAALEREDTPPTAPSGGDGVATAVWAPAAVSRTGEVSFTARDLFEIRVHDRRRRLVAAIELVSESNKDRPDARRDFVIKCASYLQQQVSVVIVDIVTTRHHDLYGDLLTLLGLPRGTGWPGEAPLYAVALRTTKDADRWRIDAWEESLRLGAALPTLPLWLASNLAIPVELEVTYEETCQVLRIE